MGADAFGSQAIVIGMDVLAVPKSQNIPSGYEIVINGGPQKKPASMRFPGRCNASVLAPGNLRQFNRCRRHQKRL